MYGTSRRFDTDFYSFLENILPRFLPRMRKITVYQYVLSLSTPVSRSTQKPPFGGGFLRGAECGSRTDSMQPSGGRLLARAGPSDTIMYSTPVSFFPIHSSLFPKRTGNFGNAHTGASYRTRRHPLSHGIRRASNKVWYDCHRQSWRF